MSEVEKLSRLMNFLSGMQCVVIGDSLFLANVSHLAHEYFLGDETGCVFFGKSTQPHMDLRLHPTNA
jgi:hypothetical protein